MPEFIEAMRIVSMLIVVPIVMQGLFEWAWRHAGEK